MTWHGTSPNRIRGSRWFTAMIEAAILSEGEG
jgi:hypothetical protein